MPPFTGGLVGYFSYDFIGYSEPCVKLPTDDSEHFKNADLMLFDKVIAFDNYRGRIVLIANVKLSDVENSYNKACDELEADGRLAEKRRKAADEPGGRLKSEVTAAVFKAAVLRNGREGKKTHR